jgi:hypothetical protein
LALETQVGYYKAAQLNCIAAHPLWRLAQQHITTRTDLAGVRIADVQRQGFVSHKVALSENRSNRRLYSQTR